MFTRRHEQELAEIKALTHELGQRFQEIVEQLDRIKENQDQLAANAEQAEQGQSVAPGQPATVGKNKPGRTEAQAVTTGTPSTKVAGSRRTRGQQQLAPVAAAAKSGKGERAARLESSEDAPERGAGRKARGGRSGRGARGGRSPRPGGRKGRGGGRRRRETGPASGAASDEE